jgi:hypothetical protein
MEVIMKSLRSLALMLVVSTFPSFLVPAYAQQEVDPDHFDQVQTNAASAPKSQAGLKTSSSHHQASQVRVASKHSGNRSHHHQARASA